MMRQLDTVEPGYYRVRLVRNGPWVPVEIVIDPLTDVIAIIEMGRDRTFEIDRQDFQEAIVACVLEAEAFNHPLIRICWFGERIDEPTYNAMLKSIAWAREHAPQAPCLHPTKPVNLNDLPVSMII